MQQTPHLSRSAAEIGEALRGRSPERGGHAKQPRSSAHPEAIANCRLQCVTTVGAQSHSNNPLTLPFQQTTKSKPKFNTMSDNNNSNNNHNDEAIKAGGAAAVGAVAGAATSAAIGSMGLTVAGTALAITAAPIIAAGAVVGLAGYSIYKLFGGK